MNDDPRVPAPVPGSAGDALSTSRGGPVARYGYAGPSSPQRDIDNDVIDLREYWNLLVRRRATVLLVVLAAIVFALVVTFNATPIYRTEVLLQIDRTANKVVEYGNVAAEDRSWFGDQEFYSTQYELLQSRSLARRVIDQVGLTRANDDPPDEASLSHRAKAYLKGLLASLTGSSGAHQQTAIDPDLKERMAEEDSFLRSLAVTPIPDSRLVEVSFESPSAQESAAIANALAANFISMNLERRYDASSYAKEFLEDQLEQMRVTLEESERRFVAYAREREIVNLDDRLEIILNKLRSMNETLVNAEAERFTAEAAWQEFQEARNGGAPDILDSEVIQSLKTRISNLQADYEQNLQVYKPGYPKMQKLQRQIDELREEVRRETAAIGASVRAEYEAKLRAEESVRQRLQEFKDEALALQDRSTDYETLRREVETNRELYDGLLQRMKEVGVAAGVGENNISVVDAARIPLSPYKPSLTKNLAIAVALGLVLGIGLAFLLELFDDTIQVGDEAEQLVGAPVLSLLPHLSARQTGLPEHEVPLVAFRQPKSPVAEAARSLRTSLLFSTADGTPKVLHFTSASPREGKTTTAVSTAIAYAQSGAKVLLVDADLRNPSLHRAFSLSNATGLTNHLAGDAEPVEIAQPSMIRNLFVIGSGPLPPNPVELMSTSKMVDLLSLAAERFDQVIIDGPPVIGLADALLLANLSQATVFIAEPGQTHKHDIIGAVRRLRQANARIIGTVLTKVGRAGQRYGYGYAYSYDYLYGYGTRDGGRQLQSEADT